MTRLFLVHWNKGESAERIERLEAAGYDVDCETKSGANVGPRLKKKPPDAVVIDLGRLPSHGRHLAVWMREQKVTRGIPIVFVDGDPEKVARLKKDLPDAVYTGWSRIKSSVKKALANPPAKPAVVRQAGYSGTPLPKKLGIKPDAVVALLGAPRGFGKTLGALPDGATTRTQARGKCDVILLFTKSAADLKKRYPAAARALADGGGLWIAWPKQASGVATDLNGNDVRAIGLESGLVDNKVCAIDDTWSGLRFVRRRK